MSVKNDLSQVIKNIESVLNEAIAPKAMRNLGEFAITLIVKRARLGYGVDTPGGEKSKLLALSEKYIESRKKMKLFNLTTPKKSNLTKTGQMLESMRVTAVRKGSVFVRPDGDRTDTDKTNQQIAKYQAKQGRVFNNVSYLEAQQLLRFYRREFGDLLNKKSLLR